MIIIRAEMLTWTTLLVALLGQRSVNVYVLCHYQCVCLVLYLAPAICSVNNASAHNYLSTLSALTSPPPFPHFAMPSYGQQCCTGRRWTGCKRLSRCDENGENCVDVPPCNLGNEIATGNSHHWDGPGGGFCFWLWENRYECANNCVCTTCPNGQFESSPPSTYTNRGCSLLSNCNPGTHVTVQHTANSNRQCGGCSSGTFTDSPNLNSCKAHRSCGKGLYISSARFATADRTCNACPDGTYQDAEPHQSTACTEQPKCGPGQKYVDLGKTTAAQCAACTAGTYQTMDNHRDPCIAHAECDEAAGQYTAVEPTPTTNRICGTNADCTEYQYEAEPPTPTTGRQCGQITLCTLGEYVTADPTPTSDRACNDCDGKVEFSGKMNSESCTPLDTCGKGEYVGAPGSRTKQLMCFACPGGQSQSLSGRRPESCFQQPRCAKGERLANADATRQGFCDMCGAGQYIEEDDHRSANCVQQPFCNENEYLAGAGLSSRGTCTECPPGTEVLDKNHRASECTLIVYDLDSTGVGEVVASFDPDATPPPGWVDQSAAGGGGNNGDEMSVTPTTTTDNEDASSSLSTGVLTGIIVAAVVLVLAIVTFCACLRKSKAGQDDPRMPRPYGEVHRQERRNVNEVANPTFQPDRSERPSARHLQPGAPQQAYGEIAQNPTSMEQAGPAEIPDGTLAATALGKSTVYYTAPNSDQPDEYDAAKLALAKGAVYYTAPNSLNSDQPGEYDAANLADAADYAEVAGVAGTQDDGEYDFVGERCARGQDSGGRKCKTPALHGQAFCFRHACEHPAGCTKSKSSSETLCAAHAAAAAAPRGGAGIQRNSGTRQQSTYAGFDAVPDEEV